MEEGHEKESDPKVSILISGKEDWLKLLYEEGWRQYVHEDNMSQTRIKFFLVIQAAIIAIFAAVSPIVYGIGIMTIWGHPWHLGLVILGSLWLIPSVFSIFLLDYWSAGIIAGEEYVRFRRMQLQCIETLAGIKQVGLATQETKWRERKENHYIPFPKVEKLKHLSIPRITPNLGLKKMEKAIHLLRTIWILFVFIAIVALILGACPIW